MTSQVLVRVPEKGYNSSDIKQCCQYENHGEKDAKDLSTHTPYKRDEVEKIWTYRIEEQSDVICEKQLAQDDKDVHHRYPGACDVGDEANYKTCRYSDANGRIKS